MEFIMIKKTVGYIIVCDVCGKKFSSEDNENIWNEYDFFETKKEAIELLQDDFMNRDWQYRNKKIYCDDHKIY